ncbi:MAG: 3-dehydroquinate synthase [Burkholderiaceae bacterium]|nr:3-dehydroquinate synthase [Burkholderiaceae bacterium]
MKHVPVAIPGGSYEIVIGAGARAQLAERIAMLAPTRLLIVTDENVAGLYADDLVRQLGTVAPTGICRLRDGESGKTLAAVEHVIDALVSHRADRKSIVVALGGGVVGDIAGFAASVFMRGIRFVQVPTTLLAQVDSSVGGKTGVNHPSGKNLIGAFHQPVLVVADTDVLRSLPARELSAGLAEVIKHGLLADADYFEAVARDMAALRQCEADALMRAVARSCEIKAGVVSRDEKESGERALLNLGHTFGHAIEALAGYGHWLHGEAVGCGMCLAADLSRRLGLVSAQDVARIEATIAAAGLPTRIAGLSHHAALASMAGDKKAEAGRIGFIVLERIGRAVQRTVLADVLDATLAAGGYV